MRISISLLVIFLVCTLALGTLFGAVFHSGLKKVILWIRNRIVDYWYLIVFVITSFYVLCNFSDCIDLAFTEKFNGKNLIFLFWLLLIFFPMFERFEGFGVSVRMRKNDKEAQTLTDGYHEEIKKATIERGENHE